MEKELTLQTPVNSVENSTESLGSSQELPSSFSPNNSTHSPTSSSPPDLLSDTGGGLVHHNGQMEGTGGHMTEAADLDNTVSSASHFPDLDQDEALKGYRLIF